MKIYRFFIAIFLLCGLNSCSDWLDIEPKDTTTETDLFATGDGYRIALNGVYRQMAETGLYGKELSWGFLDVAAQTYKSYLLSESPEYATTANYQYTDYRVKPIIEAIWSKAYNNISNCNNVIQRIEQESTSKFAEGEVEKKLIEGEALALRAYLHLDMLRLFAPSMLKDDGRQYIPYVTTYPCTFQPYSTNKEILEKAMTDLKKAKTLVQTFEMIETKWMLTANRIEGTSYPEDLFFAYRGYRMNYYAICALLARVYNYAGMHQEAFDEAGAVIDANGDGGKFFSMTTNGSVASGNIKLYDNVVFCLSNKDLWINYEPYSNGVQNLVLAEWSLTDLFDAVNDTRSQLVKLTNSNLYSIKNVENKGKLAVYAKDIIPMIRLGEMYYIRAEYYHSKNDDQKAKEELDKLRSGYNCPPDKLTGSFEGELIKEAHREYLGEGQLFYYYKKLNKRPGYSMQSDEQFVLPRPDNENL